ncbi:MAG: SufD family Fe-S cluster assembly protein [Hydrogenophilaceae bacterium]|nr:SufD family Fe-S cluster assembly protein [Hydrogenophilaceae bacterium]
MIAADLPNRRVEAWKYSDLRAALADTPLPQDAPRPAHAWGKLDGVIDRLALGLDRHALTKVRAGEEEILIERLGGEGLDASVREIQAPPGAALTRIVLQAGGGVVLNAAHVTLATGAKFRQLILADGAKLARIETHVAIEGEGAEVEMNGIYMVANGRHADLTSVVSHNVGGAKTTQLIKGVARAGGRGVFQGKIYVAHGAQKTDARQHHAALMLEEGAEINAKPELEIYADDVQCAHGNAIGALDERQLFYARARGIPEAEARAMLVEAFLNEAVPEHLPDDLRMDVLARIAGWLR